MPKKKINMTEIKVNFNDIVMREFGLDINDDDHIYDMDTNEVYMIKEKYIKYSEDEYPVIGHNEMDMNLIENPRLMEILFGTWIVKKWGNRFGYHISSFSQNAIRGSTKGFFAMTYVVNGENKEIKSDIFINESLRIFNLVCKLNHRDHMYDTTQFDIEIVRKDKK